ncbi:NUDIX domain-containing protein [Herbiconiux sp. CPCC 205763]|uniref:NUDIX domain-containing protein n=1 Tax=Herbiconiux aconitum TaxID=2970913 RepID=A0ABT2GT39_9MICO|nr:NUDIX domain-containing protein [Herbiconiux aconitum]MCS5719384.1 NUDIX domain-containing protein [Herbiconiux aconitum]
MSGAADAATADDAVILKSRVLLIDQAGRALLFFTRADVATNPTRWLTPGGHLEAGETHRRAAVRELFEETGLVVSEAQLGAVFWSQDFTGEPAPDVLRQYREEWYLLRTEAFLPVDTHWTPEERIDVEAWRWWTLDEMEKTADSLEPTVLTDLLRRALNTPLLR